MSNGYPANFIDSIVHRFLSKQFSNTDVMQPYGPHKRRVYLCLPYVGELATNKFALTDQTANCEDSSLCGAKASVSSCIKAILPHEVKIKVECFKSEWCCIPNFLLPM